LNIQPRQGVVEGGKSLLDLPPILIVDAQPEVRTEIGQSLSRVGFPVEIASDGLEALDRFKALKYSMIIADDQVPGVGGLEMLNSIKKISPKIPVVIMTANGSQRCCGDAGRCLRLYPETFSTRSP
jgi:CheY-like chemotaxis protein